MTKILVCDTLRTNSDFRIPSNILIDKDDKHVWLKISVLSLVLFMNTPGRMCDSGLLLRSKYVSSVSLENRGHEMLLILLCLTLKISILGRYANLVTRSDITIN